MVITYRRVATAGRCTVAAGAGAPVSGGLIIADALADEANTGRPSASVLERLTEVGPYLTGPADQELRAFHYLCANIMALWR